MVAVKNKTENSIIKSLRDIDNAKTTLSEKAGKVGNYSDAKYVRMACNKAWNGVLLALNYRMKKKNIPSPTKNQMDVDI